MSELVVQPSFESCCGSASESTPTANPLMYYDSTLGSPTDQGILPPFTGISALIVDSNGIASQFVWNPTNQSWV